MSTTEQELEQQETEAPETGLLHRSYAAEMTADGFGRTIDVRIVPYGVAADVSDDGQTKYREMWMPGAFADQVRGAKAGRASHVHVNFRHGQTISDVIGHGLSLREAPDAFYGSFRILDGADGDKALELVRAGALSGVSLEAFAKKTVRSVDGIVQRLKAHLVNIALTPQGAFSDAAVLAIREEELLAEREAQSLDLDVAMIDRMRAAGIRIPTRYARDELDEEVDQLLRRAFTDATWDGSASRWDTAAAYCSACAIDRNPAGQPKQKNLCDLPYKEPGSGDINLHAVRAALQRIGQGDPQDATQAQRDRARALLERLLKQGNSSMGREAPVTVPVVERAAPAKELTPLRHLDEMLTAARAYVAAEPDAEDKATMNQIVKQLQQLRQKDASGNG